MKKNQSKAEAKPYDIVLMFKIVLLQRMYQLSDEQIEFQLTGCIRFKRFVGLGFSHQAPDCNTSWNFKNYLAKGNHKRKLFDSFYAVLKEKKLVVNEGKMIDISFHKAQMKN